MCCALFDEILFDLWHQYYAYVNDGSILSLTDTLNDSSYYTLTFFKLAITSAFV